MIDQAQTDVKAASPGQSLSWETPVPLGDMPEAVPFPVEVLPPGLGQFVEEAMAALDCPADLLGPALLAAAGAAIGATRALAVKSRCERPAIFLAVVVPAGASAGAALDTITGPICQAQARALAEHPARVAQYKKDLAGWKALPDYSTLPPVLAAYCRSPEEGPRPEKPQRPILSRFFAADPPPGTVGRLPNHNPRGDFGPPE